MGTRTPHPQCIPGAQNSAVSKIAGPQMVPHLPITFRLRTSSAGPRSDLQTTRFAHQIGRTGKGLQVVNIQPHRLWQTVDVLRRRHPVVVKPSWRP
jgi:hypothetical protein